MKQICLSQLMTESQYRDLNAITHHVIETGGKPGDVKVALAKYLRTSGSIQAALRFHEVDTNYLAWILTLRAVQNYAVHYGPRG